MNAAARAYGNKFAKRKPTSSSFGVKKATTSSLPSAPPKVDLKIEAQGPPSYPFVDKQKGEADAEAESHGPEDEALRQDKGKNPVSDEQPKTTFSAPTHKVKGNQKSDQPSTEPTAKRGSDEHESFWTLETSYDIEEETYSAINEWTPNCQAMFQILRQSGSLVFNNRVMVKHHPEYLDYAVACYYSVIFYIQILRARQAADLLSGTDSSFLRRFNRKFKDEELPIAGILFPFFSTISSTLLEDSKYNWIVPRIAEENFFATMANYSPARGSVYLQPMVPYMLGNLRYAISPALKGHYYDPMSNTDASLMHFNDYDEFVPHRISATAVNLYGMNFTRGTAGTIANTTVFSAAGVDYPFRSDADQLSLAQPKWRTSSFMELKVSVIQPATNNERLVSGATIINSLENFLCMPKSSNLEWFRELINQAALHARFFKSTKNLSDVLPTSGLETLLVAELRREDNTTFDTPQLDIDENNFDWYPKTWNDMKAGFFTTRNGMDRTQVLQAITFATNATLPITVNTKLVGEVTYDDADEQYSQRKGKYFDNKEWTATTHSAAGTGKPMFRGWKTMIQSTHALVKPTGY